MEMKKYWMKIDLYRKNAKDSNTLVSLWDAQDILYGAMGYKCGFWLKQDESIDPLQGAWS